MGFTNYAVITAAFSGVAMFWGQVKGFFDRISSFVIVTVDLQSNAGDIFMQYAWKNFKRSSAAQRRFTAYTQFIRPHGRYGMVPFEMSGKALTFWNGWKPIFASASTDKDGEFTGSVKLTYLRGMFNIDKLMIEAAKQVNNDHHSMPENMSRYTVKKIFGKKKGDDEGIRYGRQPDDTPDLTVQSNIPVGFKKEELGASISKVPFSGLSYPKNILDFIAEIRRWKDSEVWFKEKNIPWRFGAGLFGQPGCHAKGTKILMYDGITKNVEDVEVGDLLMGPDSKPRKVLELARGREEMLRVIPVKGDSFIVNMSHMFHLTPSTAKDGNYTVRCPINISGRDLMYNINEPFAYRMKLTRTGVEFSKKDLPIDPYILGLWLGDGTSSKPELSNIDEEIINEWKEFGKKHGMEWSMHGGLVYALSGGLPGHGPGRGGRNFLKTTLKELEVLNNKHIPWIYKTSDRNDRMQLLGGLLDSDGHHNNGGYEIVQKNERLADDIAHLARSLGLAAYKTKKIAKCQTGAVGTYHRIYISGDCKDIPVRTPRKKSFQRNQIKSVLRTGFSLEVLPEDDYYGFCLDKDHLYLTSDFTIHHNSGKTSLIRATAQDLDMPIHIYDLSTLSNEELTKAWSKSLNATPCVILFEDLDRIFDKDKNVGSSDKKAALTMDCLLNCINGVESSDGLLIFVTANDHTKLDHALGIPDSTGRSTRPGRLDKIVFFGPLEEQNRRDIAKRILADVPELIEETVKVGDGETGAQFESRCTKIALDHYWGRVESSREETTASKLGITKNSLHAAKNGSDM